MNFFVVIPAHNEKSHIASVIAGVMKTTKNIIIVDDGSSDDTYTEAQKSGKTVLKHVINLGKGAAMKTGAEMAIKLGAEAIIFIDSDGQHKPADIPRLAKELEKADIVFTYRNLKSEHMPIVKKMGNNFLNMLMKLLFGISLADTQCGFKAVTASAYKKMNLISNDYNIESEIAAKAGKHRLKYMQIPIETVYRDKYKGTTILDGINIASRMIWWKISR